MIIGNFADIFLTQITLITPITQNWPSRDGASRRD
jgi:hypothetical protein